MKLFVTCVLLFGACAVNGKGWGPWITFLYSYSYRASHFACLRLAEQFTIFGKAPPSNVGKVSVVDDVVAIVDTVVDLLPGKVTKEEKRPIEVIPVAPIVDPSEIPELTPCPYGDSVCIIDRINIALKTLFAGVPRLNLLPFDPLYAHKTLRIAQLEDVQSIVNLDFTFTDNQIVGFRDHVCTYVSGFNRDPTGDYEIRLKGPSSTLHGTYALKGGLFAKEARGTGYSNFTIGKHHGRLCDAECVGLI